MIYNAKSLAILIPCYNEHLTVGKVVDDFRDEFPSASVIVYDNNSDDGSAGIAAEHGAVVFHAPVQGKGAVVKQMFSDIYADYYIMVDADDTYPAVYAHSLLGGLSKADMVIGDRLSVNYYADNERPFHGAGNRLVKDLINHMYHGNVSDILTGYRAFTRKFVENVHLTSDGFEIETEMTIRALQAGLKIGTVPVKYRSRHLGSHSKLNTFSDGWKVMHMVFSLYKRH